MNPLNKVIIAVLCLTILISFTLFTLTPGGKMITNTYNNILQKVDDRTSYETRKEVENYCRAAISSYKTDKLTYEQYKNSSSELERSWASQAKMRANKTANIYNEYILKNSYVFEGNIPEDINMKLEILE